MLFVQTSFGFTRIKLRYCEKFDTMIWLALVDMIIFEVYLRYLGHFDPPSYKNEYNKQ